MPDSPAQDQLFLELGDIIRINAPSNDTLHQHVFYIDYLDDNEIDIVDDTTDAQTNIKILMANFQIKVLKVLKFSAGLKRKVTRDKII